MTGEDPGVVSRQRIDRKASRRAFDRAAPLYAEAAVLAREIGSRHLERLALIRVEPKHILDLGCGSGTHTLALSQRFPDATLIALDFSHAMLAQLENEHKPTDAGGTLSRIQRWFSVSTQQKRRILPLQADFERLPLAPGSIDFVWSNLALAYAVDLPRVIQDISRVTRTNGLVMLTLPGPDTLAELRAALALLGLPDSTHPFPDMHDVGDMLMTAGFANPVVDSERITLEYTTTQRLRADLRALGALTARTDRPRGLMTPRRLRKIEDALRGAAHADRQQESPGGSTCIRLTVEVAYAHAWKAEPRTIGNGRAIVRFERRARPQAAGTARPADDRV
ncbi:MAG: methyltransferase domain-containing protein [Casimicrobiaceae bacterium]